jgi:hypothetical protein
MQEGLQSSWARQGQRRNIITLLLLLLLLLLAEAMYARCSRYRHPQKDTAWDEA